MKASTKKQIESATKNVEALTAKVAKFNERRLRNLEKFGYKADQFTTGFHMGWAEVVYVGPKEAYDCENVAKITDAWESELNNQKKLIAETQRLADLTREAETQDKAESDYNAIVNPIIEALTKNLEQYKETWKATAIEDAGKWYDRAKVRYQELDERYKAAQAEKVDYWTRVAIAANRDKFKFAVRMTREDYIERRRKDLEADWSTALATLADRVSKFGLDASKLEVYYPKMSGYMEVIIKDGGTRIINARLIWCAEYSDIVTPHFRYIATEKH